MLHTRLACSQDGSHAREEEANLSAVLAVWERWRIVYNPFPARIQECSGKSGIEREREG
jgi:hypothetical protein